MHKYLTKVFFFALLLITTLSFFCLIESFLLGIFWAIVLAILFGGLYQRMVDKMKGKRDLPAALTVLLVIVIVVIPVGVTTVSVINQGTYLYSEIDKEDLNTNSAIESLLDFAPVDDSFYTRFGTSKVAVKKRIRLGVSNGVKIFANRAIDFSENFFSFVVQLSLMLYLLFFFLRDADKIMDSISEVIPMGEKEEWTLLYRFESVTKATVKGGLLVALLQGFLGGMMFFLLDIQGAFLWGVLMVILSLLPIGSVLVWGPAALIMFIQGQVLEGVIIIVVGTLLIGLVDNFLRPWLVGKDTKMPDYIILISTLGGLSLFGITGFVLGPVIAALFITTWQMQGKLYGKKRSFKLIRHPEALETPAPILETPGYEIPANLVEPDLTKPD